MFLVISLFSSLTWIFCLACILFLNTTPVWVPQHTKSWTVTKPYDMTLASQDQLLHCLPEGESRSFSGSLHVSLHCTAGTRTNPFVCFILRTFQGHYPPLSLSPPYTFTLSHTVFLPALVPMLLPYPLSFLSFPPRILPLLILSHLPTLATFVPAHMSRYVTLC